MKKKTTMVPLSAIHPNERNPRTMKRDAFARLCDSVKRDPEFMMLRPIVIDDSGMVLGGNQRYRACQKLGMLEIPATWVIKASDLTPEKRKRFILVDNAPPGSTGDWDDDILAADWDNAELEALGFELEEKGPAEPADAAVDLDSADELAKKWRVSAGQVWALGKHRIICGDCTDPAVLSKLLQGEKPHLLCTDPPYGVEYKPEWRNDVGLPSLGKYKSKRQIGKVLNDDRASWSAVFSRMPCDVAYVWHGGLHVVEVARSLEVAGFELKAQIIWAKKHFVMGRSRYQWRHESCWFAVRKGAQDHWQGSRKQATVWADIVDSYKPDLDMFAGRIDESTLGVFPGSMTTVWELGKDKAAKGGHSTQKPLECMARCVRNSSKPGDGVLEPFAGTGTTVVACENLQRRCFAVELHPGYVGVVLQRMQDAFGIVGTLVRDGG